MITLYAVISIYYCDSKLIKLGMIGVACGRLILWSCDSYLSTFMTQFCGHKTLVSSSSLVCT